MNIDGAFPSKYLKVADLQGKDVTVTMTEVRMEEVEETGTKPVLYFQGAQKGMVLNKTNALNVSTLYGPETDTWIGKQVTIFTTQTEYKGKPTLGLRLRAPGTAAPLTVSQQIAAGVQVSAMPVSTGPIETGMAAQAPIAPVPESEYAAPLVDDEIPF